MAEATLRTLFITELKDIFDAETRITKALPKMIKAASSTTLTSALETHLKLTMEHVARLERVFGMFGTPPSRKTCKAMVGLLAEGEELLKEDGAPGLRDAAIIAAAQKVEHYEMATYGCLRTWAQRLGENKAADLLQKTLTEEGEADQALTGIALSLNVEATEDDEEAETVPATRRPATAVRPIVKPRGR